MRHYYVYAKDDIREYPVKDKEPLFVIATDNPESFEKIIKGKIAPQHLVYVDCYNKVSIYIKDEAIKDFSAGMCFCEGSEAERYQEIYGQLIRENSCCSDNLEKNPYNVCASTVKAYVEFKDSIKDKPGAPDQREIPDKDKFDDWER